MTLYDFVKKHNISRTFFIIYFTFFVLIFYFAFLAMFGQKGLVEYFSLRGQIYNQNLTKKELQNEIRRKKIRVQGMKPQSLDLDLLDEEARKNLGYSAKDEIIIYQQKDKNNDE